MLLLTWSTLRGLRRLTERHTQPCCGTSFRWHVGCSSHIAWCYKLRREGPGSINQCNEGGPLLAAREDRGTFHSAVWGLVDCDSVKRLCWAALV